MYTELRLRLLAEDVLCFFKCNTANSFKAAPAKGIQFSAFDRLESHIFCLRHQHTDPDSFEPRKPLVSLERFIGRGLAGMTAASLCSPLDTVDKMLRLQDISGRPVQYKSMTNAALKIDTTQGFGALYRGLQSMGVSTVPSVGVFYVVDERVKRMLGM